MSQGEAWTLDCARILLGQTADLQDVRAGYATTQKRSKDKWKDLVLRVSELAVYITI